MREHWKYVGVARHGIDNMRCYEFKYDAPDDPRCDQMTCTVPIDSYWAATTVSPLV